MTLSAQHSLSPDTPLEALVAKRLGLKLSPLDVGRLRRFVDERLAQTRLSRADYEARLERDNASSTGEWQALAQHLTNNESFFFRDNGLFALLQSKLLPELIEQNRGTRTLRIWSAGCSRGEEIYSIAMLLIDLLGLEEGTKDWKLQLFGTDLNEQVLMQAREGKYSDWSLRGVGDNWKQRYFTRKGTEWQLDHRVREQVTFRGLNLMADAYPEPINFVSGMDLIICRNVFIYFSAEAVQATVERFERCLKMGGLLISGHSELRTNMSPGLAMQVLPGSSVFKRVPPQSAKPVTVSVLPSLTKAVLKHTPAKRTPSVAGGLGNDIPRDSSSRIGVRSGYSSSNATESFKGYKGKARGASPPDSNATSRPTNANEPQRHTLLSKAIHSFAEARYENAIKQLEGFPSDGADTDPETIITALKIRAESWSNLGQYEQALAAVEAAIKLAPFAAELFYLFAHIAELKGDKPGAIQALEKCLYLDDDFIPAYIDLAALLEIEGRSSRAHRLRATAIKLLKALPATHEIAPYSGVTVSDLLEYLGELVDQHKGPLAHEV